MYICVDLMPVLLRSGTNHDLQLLFGLGLVCITDVYGQSDASGFSISNPHIGFVTYVYSRL